MKWFVLVTILVTIVAGVSGEEEACKPKPGKWMRANDCCRLGNFLPDTMMSSMKKCITKYPPVRPAGPPPSGQPPTPSPEMRNSRACLVECVFQDQGLLTTDKQLDKTVITKYFSSIDNKDLVPAMRDAVDKCLSSHKTEVDSALECKSGADEFKRCLTRQLLLSCPEASWTSSSDCEEFKERLIKCPKMPVPVGPGPRPSTTKSSLH